MRESINNNDNKSVQVSQMKIMDGKHVSHLYLNLPFAIRYHASLMLSSHQIICCQLDRQKLGAALIASNSLQPVRSDGREQII